MSTAIKNDGEPAVDALVQICDALGRGEIEKAQQLTTTEIPFEPFQPVKRSYSEKDAVRIFIRDGFRDRYSGDRLVYPGALRLISKLIPNEFPYHPNWKLSECHFLFWALSPTVDHVVPVTRGGADEEENWVCTSMLRNLAKGHWTLEELGWSLRPRPPKQDWDGLTNWFTSYVTEHRDLLNDRFLKRWFDAARKAG